MCLQVSNLAKHSRKATDTPAAPVLHNHLKHNLLSESDLAWPQDPTRYPNFATGIGGIFLSESKISPDRHLRLLSVVLVKSGSENSVEISGVQPEVQGL